MVSYGESAGTALGPNAGSGIGSEEVSVIPSWLFFVFPVRERLSDI